jgi:hypothetical protein
MQTKYENNLMPLCTVCAVFSMLAMVHTESVNYGRAGERLNLSNSIGGI